MLFKRIFVVILLGPVLLGILFLSPPIGFKLFVLACTILALWEYFRIVSYAKRQLILGILAGAMHSALILFAPWNTEMLLLEQTLIVLGFFILFVFFAPKHMEGSLSQLGFTLLGVFYVAMLTSFIGLIRDFSDGALLVFLLLAMTWLNDTAAYFFGHYFGKRHLAPQLSPGKTVEGFLGGYIGTTVAYFAILPFLQNAPTWGEGLLLILLVGTMGPLGDLAESLFKRNFGIKDSGNMIPGHGGILDRIDALLFTAPVLYAFWKYVVLR